MTVKMVEWPPIPRRADVEKQNWGLRGGNEEGWVITLELGSSAASPVVAVSLD